MDDLISRQAAIEAFNTNLNELVVGGEKNAKTVENYLNRVLDKIKCLPPAEPKKGKWIKADVCGNITSWECSCCHNWTGLPTGWNVKAKLWFCPKCTADMREATT